MPRLLLLVFLMVGLVSGAEITATVIVPDAKLAEVQAALEAFRQQMPTPGAAGIARFASTQELLDAILADAVRQILNRTPPASVKAQRDKIEAASQAARKELEGLVRKKTGP